MQNDLISQVTALTSEAEELQAKAVLVHRQAVEWQRLITDRVWESRARVERDWNLQLADTYRIRASYLKRKAKCLNRRRTLKQIINKLEKKDGTS